MNKVVIISIVLGILLLAGGAFAFMNRPQPTTIPTQTEETTTDSQPTTEKQSIKALMQQGTNQECNFTDTESGSTGTLYIGSAQARGDFQTQMDGAAYNSHMIYDGQMVYIWTDGQNQGVQMNVSAMESVGNNQSIDVNREVDYSCKGWNANSSFFTPPASITFQDMTSTMQDAQNMMQKISGSPMPDMSSQCATCDNLPAEAQAQCKTAFNCN